MRRRILFQDDDTNGIIINGYEFVDMGLSVAWATCNVGATKPEEYGWYFQWGGTIPYNSDLTPVGGGMAITFSSNSNCPYWVSGSGSSSKWSKYTSMSQYSPTGTPDNKLILDSWDDAAHVHIGGDSRMPTHEEFLELLNACNTTWVTNYNGTGINGRLFILKTDPSKTLFFPAAGYLNSTSWNNATSTAQYSSSTLYYTLGSYSSRQMSANSSSAGTGAGNRYRGVPIRAVLPLNNTSVVLYKKSTGKLIQTPYPTLLDKNKYEPVGIVVIPSSHDVYGTDECGVMALHSASTTTPDSGSTINQTMPWGQNGTDITELFNYSHIVYSKINGNDTGTAQGVKTNESVYLPSDSFSASQCSTDPLAYYNWDDNDPYAPSPYLADGSRNPAYYQTSSPSNGGNVLSDFKGKTNTGILISNYTGQPGWKTDTSIVSESGKGHSPAAAACWRYSTKGTKQGDWYLPAMGELGYACVRRKKINEAISSLQSYFGKTYCTLGSSDNLLSSSEQSGSTSWGLRLNTGGIRYNISKSESNVVRPFMRKSIPTYISWSPSRTRKEGDEIINGYEFVDMGLSVKWAKYNIGASQVNEYGWYFQWGGIIPYNSDRTPVTGGAAINFWYNSTCPHWVSGTETNSKWSKYTNTNGYSSTGMRDGKLILDPWDDAAHVYVGGWSRMPTVEEFNELLNACNTTWVYNIDLSGGLSVYGCNFTLKADSSKKVFFPAAGYITDASMTGVGSTGRCWLSSHHSDLQYMGRYVSTSDGSYTLGSMLRCNGLPIRAVLPSY